jgi:hypothetical protein
LPRVDRAVVEEAKRFGSRHDSVVETHSPRERQPTSSMKCGMRAHRSVPAPTSADGGHSSLATAPVGRQRRSSETRRVRAAIRRFRRLLHRTTIATRDHWQRLDRTTRGDPRPAP